MHGRFSGNESGLKSCACMVIQWLEWACTSCAIEIQMVGQGFGSAVLT